MEEERSDEIEQPMSALSKVLWTVGGVLFLLFVVHYGVKTFRNSDHRELSERFIRGNAIVREEAGDILRLSGGESSLSGAGEWVVSRTITGTSKKLLITIFMHCNQGSTDVGVGCTIQRATYRSESPADPEREIPITWYDSFSIVYR
jgi:hypothetical protein